MTPGKSTNIWPFGRGTPPSVLTGDPIVVIVYETGKPPRIVTQQ